MSLLSTIKQWGGKGAWALMDQVCFATSNFLISILLARWVTPEEYGIYAIAFAIFLFIGAVHNGLLSNPMMVLSAGKYKKDFPAYLGGVLYGHWVFSAAAVLCALLAAMITWLFGGAAFASALFFMGLAVPFILFQWLMRHAAYAVLKPRLAAIAGGIHCVIVVGGVFACSQLGLLTKESKNVAAIAFTLTGTTSFLSAFWLSRKLKIDRRHRTRVKYMKDAVKSHKDLGSWGSGVVILHWLSGEIFLLLSPIFGGIQFTAALRALLNLITPINRVFTAFGTLAVVALGRARAAGQLGKSMSVAFLAGGTIGLSYWLFLGLFQHQITTFLYGEEEIYQQGGKLIWIIGLMAIVGGAKAVLEPALWAMETAKGNFHFLRN